MPCLPTTCSLFASLGGFRHVPQEQLPKAYGTCTAMKRGSALAPFETTVVSDGKNSHVRVSPNRCHVLLRGNWLKGAKSGRRQIGETCVAIIPPPAVMAGAWSRGHPPRSRRSSCAP